MKRKIVDLPEIRHESEGHNESTVTLEQLRVIWNDSENTYSDKQLLKVRKWLYCMARIVISFPTDESCQHEDKQAA